MQLVVSGFCRPVTRVRDSLQDADVQCAHITQSVVLRARIMNARDLQRYKQLLLTKLDELSAARAETASRVLGAGSPMGDLGDQANADAEAELHIQVHQGDGSLQRAIDDALARISQDRFGVCEVCKCTMSKARLEAVPWTRLCRDCKEHEQN